MCTKDVYFQDIPWQLLVNYISFLCRAGQAEEMLMVAALAAPWPRSITKSLFHSTTKVYGTVLS